MKYTVTVSVSGYCFVEVDAENEQEAKEKACQEVGYMDFNRLESIDWYAEDVEEENHPSEIKFE